MSGGIFREPPGRYVGYSYVVGRVSPDDMVSPVSKRWLLGATVAYITIDTAYKATDERSPNMASKAVDALLWQSLSSVTIPFFIVKGVSLGSSILMKKLKVSSPANRSPPGRYLGYAYVVSRALPGELLPHSSRVWFFRATVAYIAFDAFYKATDKRSPNAVVKMVDALMWQGLASILIPTFVVQGVAQGSSVLMHSMKVSSPANRYIPLALILLSMPLFGGAIDRGVHFVLDHTTRPILMGKDRN